MKKLKPLLFLLLAGCSVLMSGCAFTERQKLAQISTAIQYEDSKRVAATFFEALARGDEARYLSMLSPAQTRQNPQLHLMVKNEFAPRMNDFVAWSASPTVSIVKNLDANAELPGPFYIVERMAKLRSGEGACFIAIVEFGANGRGYVSSLYRGKTNTDARRKVRADLKGA